MSNEEGLKLDVPRLELDTRELTLDNYDIKLNKVCFMQGESIGKINRVIYILSTVKLLEEVEEHGYVSNYLTSCINLLDEVKVIEGIE
jgi:hypothetical protein